MIHERPSSAVPSTPRYFKPVTLVRSEAQAAAHEVPRHSQYLQHYGRPERAKRCSEGRLRSCGKRRSASPGAPTEVLLVVDGVLGPGEDPAEGLQGGKC